MQLGQSAELAPDCNQAETMFIFIRRNLPVRVMLIAQIIAARSHLTANWRPSLKVRAFAGAAGFLSLR